MKAFFTIVLLGVVAVGGVGYWNYERNAALDEDLQHRPFKTYSTEQVSQLLDAHRQNVTSLAAAAGQAPSMNVRGVDESDLEGKIDAFDRFQRKNSQWKTKHRRALTEMTQVDALELELSIREAGLDQEWVRITRRATHF